MLPFRRLVPAFKSCLFSVSRPITSSVPRRVESSSPTALDTEEEDPLASDDFQDTMSERDSGPASYKQFLEDIGYKYKYASPQLWLGNKPFPMNPSFKPPPPISDEQRETIYRLYWLDSEKYSVRKLSKIFNISLKRVTAILRLKNLEKNWIKGKELQTGFLFGMEKLLNAQTHNVVEPLQLSSDYQKTLDVHPYRSDVNQADLIEQEEQRDTLKAGFEQLYWETIPEGSQEPILPLSLQEAQKTAISRQAKKKAKANRKFMHPIPDTEFIKSPTYKVLTLTRKSGPTTRFVNVGSAFVNAHELEKRKVVSQLRQRKSIARSRVSGAVRVEISGDRLRRHRRREREVKARERKSRVRSGSVSSHELEKRQGVSQRNLRKPAFIAHEHEKEQIVLQRKARKSRIRSTPTKWDMNWFYSQRKSRKSRIRSTPKENHEPTRQIS